MNILSGLVALPWPIKVWSKVNYVSIVDKVCYVFPHGVVTSVSKYCVCAVEVSEDINRDVVIY